MGRVNAKIDLRNADGYTVTPEDILKKLIDSKAPLRRIKKDLLFRAIPDTPERRNAIDEHGKDKPSYDTIMALNYSQVFETPADTTLFDYLDRGERGLVMIYDGRRMTRDNGLGDYQYKFNNPDDRGRALIGLLEARLE